MFYYKVLKVFTLSDFWFQSRIAEMVSGGIYWDSESRVFWGAKNYIRRNTGTDFKAGMQNRPEFPSSPGTEPCLTSIDISINRYWRRTGVNLPSRPVAVNPSIPDCQN